MALFVGAAAFTLGAMRKVLETLDRAERTRQGVDIARTKLAELEAGLITVGDLRALALDGDLPDPFGRDDLAGVEFGRQRWRIDVRTERSAHRGLTLVEIEVAEHSLDDATARDAVVLRQFVDLRETEPEPDRPDDLVIDLPRGTP